MKKLKTYITSMMMALKRHNPAFDLCCNLYGYKPFSYIIDPYTGNALPASDAEDLYCGLWIAYFNKHPEVVQYAEQFDDFADNYKNADDREISNVDVIQAYIKGNRGALVSDVKTGHWYTNLLRSKKERSVRSVADYAREFGKLSAKKNMEREN